MSAMLAERPALAPSTAGPCPVIETARLVLRPHRMQDADAIVTSLSDFAVSRMLTRVPVPYDQEDGRDWLNMVTSGMKPDWHFAITLDGVNQRLSVEDVVTHRNQGLSWISWHRLRVVRLLAECRNLDRVGLINFDHAELRCDGDWLPNGGNSGFHARVNV